MIRLVSLAIGAALIAFTPAIARDFAPRDECRKLAGADAFRTQLTAAVTEKDEQKLLKLVADDVLLDFGGGSGKDELSKRLDSEPYFLWRELETILSLGCASDDPAGMTMPWYFNQDMGPVDPFAGVLVTGRRVALREKPSLESRVITRLSWVPLVVDLEEEPIGDFLPVQQPGGPRGYVHTDYLRSFVDYRVLASNIDGKWQITVFIAGD